MSVSRTASRRLATRVLTLVLAATLTMAMADSWQATAAPPAMVASAPGVDESGIAMDEDGGEGVDPDGFATEDAEIIPVTKADLAAGVDLDAQQMPVAQDLDAPVVALPLAPPVTQVKSKAVDLPDAEVVVIDPGAPVGDVLETVDGDVVGAEDVPVLIGAAPDAAPVEVEVIGQAQARKAGVNGVLFTIQGFTEGPIGIDYSEFADAIGGFGDRVHLVTLPECAVTSPELPECREQTPLDSTNQASESVVTVDLSAEQVDVLTQPAQGLRTAPKVVNEATNEPAAGMLVMAAVPAPSGPKGDFTVSTLGPAGSWSSSGGTGAFAWSYPIQTTPPGTGQAPAVALSYNSQAADGRISSTNNQSSWIGQGFDYKPGFVERTYRTCKDIPDVAESKKTSDLCWAGQIVTMNLNGTNTSLVRDDATGAWRPQNDNGQKVELLTGSANGARSGEYWKVTTGDGTQYFFGKHTMPGNGTDLTDSVLTAPVYAANPDDPCYNSASFAASVCKQGWRWNLDLVLDPNLNATIYYYEKETNRYDANKGELTRTYDRAATLDRIEYGLRQSGASFVGLAHNQLDFTTADRCISTCSATTASHWPETPIDLACTSTTTCPMQSPTFWSTKRLAFIHSKYRDPATAEWVKVDAYTLGQQYNSAADDQMNLQTIQRKGYAPDGTSITLSPVMLSYTPLENRVLDWKPGVSEASMAFDRLTQIVSETTGVINVQYWNTEADGPGQCTAAQALNMATGTATEMDTKLKANTTTCFPVYWTRDAQETPTLDFFRKYMVKQVRESNPYSVGTPAMTPAKPVTYFYRGGSAWHLDDSELTPKKERTYNQFRGYRQVETRAGSTATLSNGAANKLTKTVTWYLRGMGSPVTNSTGDPHEDLDEFAGLVQETQTFEGVAGNQISTSQSTYAQLGVTSTRDRGNDIPPLRSTMVRRIKSLSITNVASPAGATLRSANTNTYDSSGRVASSQSTGTDVAPACTTYRYATDPAAPTGRPFRSNVYEQIVSAQECPAAGTQPSPVIALSRTSYDSAVLGQVPGPGNMTKIQQAIKPEAGDYRLATTTFTYDPYGRLIESRPYALHGSTGRPTSFVYTPAGAGPLTLVETTNPENQVSRVRITPGRAVPTVTVDVAGGRTEADYDQLGRLVTLFEPAQPRSEERPSKTYSYKMVPYEPMAVTQKTLVQYQYKTDQLVKEDYAWATSISLYDGLGQLLQTQTDAEENTPAAGDREAARLISDNYYDSHGWVVGTAANWFGSAVPTPEVAVTAEITLKHSRTETTYDEAGRAVIVKALDGSTEKSRATLVHGGDRTTTFPQEGGVISTSIYDARGSVSRVREYRTPPAVTGDVVSAPSSSYVDVTYGYDVLGQMTDMTDAVGAVWTYQYDMAGRQTHRTDPDSGASSTVYNDVNDVVSTTDARGITLANTVDKLGRRTAVAQGSTTIATWTWDTLREGQLTSSTRYDNGNAYKVAITGYTSAGQPTGRSVSIPDAEQGLAGTYNTNYWWTRTGLLAYEQVFGFGNLVTETLIPSYTALGNQKALQGSTAAQIVNTTFSPTGQPVLIEQGVGGFEADTAITYDLHTNRVKNLNMSIPGTRPRVEYIGYVYDDAGNLLRSRNVQGDDQAGDPAPVQDTCYRYDGLNRLTKAWSSATECTVDPPETGVVTGAQPFWTTWSFDDVGNRTQQVRHATTPGNGNTTTNYTYSDPNHQHALSSWQQTSATGAQTSSTYTYNQTGGTLTRSQDNVQIDYTWGGRTNTITSTSGGTSRYIYDADGNILIRRDGDGSRTLFNGRDEIKWTSAAGRTGIRSYTFAGRVFGQAFGSSDVRANFADLTGTSMTTVRLNGGTTAFQIIRRHMGAYGTTQGTQQGTWPDRNKYLDKPGNPAGFVDMGARIYDPTTGRFLSVDPILSPYSPRQNNGYNYGWNNPLTHPDPTGLKAVGTYDSTWVNPGPPEPTPAPAATPSPSSASESTPNQPRFGKGTPTGLRQEIGDGCGNNPWNITKYTCEAGKAAGEAVADGVEYAIENPGKAALWVLGVSSCGETGMFYQCMMEVKLSVGLLALGVAGRMLGPGARSVAPAVAERAVPTIANSLKGLTAAEQAIAQQARAIYTHADFAVIRNGYATATEVEVKLNGTTVMYNPELNASGFTLLGENGFILGREAFTTEAELAKTIGHESQRLATTVVEDVGGQYVKDHTDAAFDFAERAGEYILTGN